MNNTLSAQAYYSPISYYGNPYQDPTANPIELGCFPDISDIFSPMEPADDSLSRLADIARGRRTFDAGEAETEAAAKPAHHRINAKKIHMTQTYDPKYNRSGSSHSGDCVPTSLMMGFKAIGKGPKKGSVQDKIDRVRYQMTHGVGNERDGVDSRGRRSSAEHGVGTYMSDVRLGARRAGVKTKDTHNAREVANQVMKGNPVVLFGSNSGEVYAKKNKDKFRTFFDGNHGILVSGYDPKTKKYTINDPLSHGGPIKISRKQLRDFMGRDSSADGIALQRPKA